MVWFTAPVRILPDRGAEIAIDKPGYSAFARTDLDHRLRLRDIETLFLSGITTEVCVSSTLRDAVDRRGRRAPIFQWIPEPVQTASLRCV